MKSNIILSLLFVSVDASLRVLFIGDSIDRYALEDWCEGRGHHCKALNQMGLYSWKPTSCSTKALGPDTTLNSLFNHTKRINSWSIAVCDDITHNITLGFLFNMQGVSPYRPWFDPAKSCQGMLGYPPLNKAVTVNDTFTFAQGPAIAPLIKAMGGPPHAVTLNSIFWDISRLVTTESGVNEEGVRICETPHLRSEWVKDWARNASELVDVTFNLLGNIPWKGWRAANPISNPIPPCRQDMVLEMNAAARAIAARKHLHYLDYFNLPNVSVGMRDAHHPNREVSVAYVKKLLMRIRRSGGRVDASS